MKPLLWKWVLIAAVTIAGAAFTFPLGKRINLGLDLRGGSHIVLQADPGSAIKFQLDRTVSYLGARLDEAGLRALADAGGGRYAGIAADSSDLDALLGGTLPAAGGPLGAAEGAAEGTRWRDRGPWLLLLLLPLALAGFRRGWLMLLPLVLMSAAPPAQAGVFADLWQRRDQQAAAALREGDAKRAAELAPRPPGAARLPIAQAISPRPASTSPKQAAPTPPTTAAMRSRASSATRTHCRPTMERCGSIREWRTRGRIAKRSRRS